MKAEPVFPWSDLSPEDALECRRDLLLYGSAFVRVLPDGAKVHVPAKEIALVDFSPGADPAPWWQSAGPKRN